jgi:hypothetical protein
VWSAPLRADCVEQERCSPGFVAHELAITEQRPDGSISAIVWKPRSGGRRTTHVGTQSGVDAQIHVGGLAVRVDHDRARESERAVGKVLADDEEVFVPCGRRHGGYRRADGVLVDGEPGGEKVSNARFWAEVGRTATS